MRIAEIFESIQGEGQFAGTPSAFVRTTGCNLRCWFCDSQYTSWRPEGQQRTWQDVRAEVLATGCEHVVITGGEPLLQPDVVPLSRALIAAGRVVTFETAGTVFRPVAASLMSISPKRPNSTPTDPVWGPRHEQIRDNASVVARMIAEYSCQLKFVIDHWDDIDDVDRYVASLPNAPHDCVWLMPQAVTAEMLAEKMVWLKPAASERGYRFSPRLHIELFGNTRGT